MKESRLVPLLLLQLVFCLFIPALPNRAPDNPTVLKEHQELLKKYNLEETKTADNPKPRQTDQQPMETPPEQDQFLNRFAHWLQRLSIPVIIFIVIILAGLFIFFFRGRSGILPSIQWGGTSELPKQAEQTFKPSGDNALAQAQARAQKNQLGEALVILHKASLKRLQQHRLVPPGDHYTNNQVRHLLAHNGTGEADAFSQLAIAAERTAFRGEEPTESAFADLMTLYCLVFEERTTGNRS